MVLFQTSFHWLHGDFQVSGRNSSPCSYWLHVAGWELYVCKRLRACERQFLQMEGLLLKWTNYLSGWKPRYFVLDSGILSYYDSPEDVGKVSKGSIKMAVCEIRGNALPPPSPIFLHSQGVLGLPCSRNLLLIMATCWWCHIGDFLVLDTSVSNLVVPLCFQTLAALWFQSEWHFFPQCRNLFVN
uniref:PH domain-containing protein n=1 Tax=Xenopus tropicalis TaxID=8364 RepID=A0A803JRV8_XENTR